MTWQMNKVTVIGLIAMSFQIVNDTSGYPIQNSEPRCTFKI